MPVPLGHGGRIRSHYPSSSADPVALWVNPANFNNSGTIFSQPFTPPTNANTLQFSYQVTMDKGWLAFSEAALSHLNPAYTIIRKTYALGGQTIATRISGDQEGESDGLYYIHSDHLGSTTVMSNAAGQKVIDSETRYLPFGDYRVEPNHDLTDRGFTGHKHNDDLGLVYMNARFYVGSIGRFASADTIVPDPMNPQQFNRYTYTLNNPLRFTDSTGHCAESYDATDNDFDAAMLQYCVESVLFLGQHWAQSGVDWDYLSLIRWMMQYADIDTVLSYYDREELTHLEDIPTPPQGPQGCIRLHGGVEKCAPDGGWPEYYPLTEEGKEFLMESGIRIFLSPIGPLVGKFIKQPITRLLTTGAIKHGVLRPIARCTTGISCGTGEHMSSSLTTDLEPVSAVIFNQTSNVWHPPFVHPQATWHPPLQYFNSAPRLFVVQN